LIPRPLAAGLPIKNGVQGLPWSLIPFIGLIKLASWLKSTQNLKDTSKKAYSLLGGCELAFSGYLLSSFPPEGLGCEK